MRVDPTVADDLKSLLAFAHSSTAAPFLRSAAREFFGNKGLPESDAPPGFADYVLFSHRDEHDRSLQDHFGDAAGGERGVLDRLGPSDLGLFRIRGVEGTDGVLERVGTGTKTRVSLGAELPAEIKAGSAIVARVIRTSGGNVLAGVFGSPSTRDVDLVERVSKGLGDWDLLEDPVLLHRFAATTALEFRSSPNALMEARREAAEVFARLGLPLTMEDVEEKFQKRETAAELLISLPRYLPAENEAAVAELTMVISKLWNHTPREDLGGVSPAEHDLTQGKAVLEHPAALPTENASLWPPEQLQALLNSGKELSAFWALSRAVENRDVIASLDLAPAVDMLLRSENESVVGDSLIALELVQDTSLAGSIAAQIASRRDAISEEHLREEADVVLAALDPIGQAERLRRRCEADEMYSASASAALARLGTPRDADLLLRRCKSRADLEVSIEALAALVGMRDSTRVAAALPELLDRARVDLEVKTTALYGLLLKAVTGSMGLIQRSEDLLKARLIPEEDQKALKCLLRPAADPSARERALRVLPDARLEELQDVAVAEVTGDLIAALRNLAVEASADAAGGNPHFAALAEVIRIAAATLAAPERIALITEPEGAEALAATLLGLLACALRGRDVKIELPLAKQDPTKLLDLALLDDDSTDLEALEMLVAADSPAEAIEPLLESPDYHVAITARWVLAGKSPQRHFKAVALDVNYAGDPGRFGAIVRPLKDAVLPQIVEAASEAPDALGPRIALLTAVESLASERARAYLESNLEILEAPGVRLTEAVRAAVACRSQMAAERVVRIVRSGRVALDVSLNAWLDGEPSDAETELAMMCEVCELEVDVQGAFKEALERREFCDGVDTDHDHDHRHPSSPRIIEPYPVSDAFREKPVEPIVRESPKVPRNDPCPCGSGKKYKKCCGKE